MAKPNKVVKPRTPPAAGKGRVKGTPNKITKVLKDAIIMAATNAGEGDMAAYLEVQAIENPGPFMALLGKVIPLQVAGDAENPLTLNVFVGGERPNDDS
jgi:hypothetical protein